jgi:cation transport ATPase
MGLEVVMLTGDRYPTASAIAAELEHRFSILEQTPREHPNIKPLTGKLQGRYRC